MASCCTSTKMAEMTEEFGEPRAKNETTFNIAMTTELRFYAYLSRSSMANKRLAGSMKLFATG